MIWRKFNGDPIELPILDAVEQAIRRETEKGFRLKVCIGTDSQVKGQETELFFCGKGMAVLCSSTMIKPGISSPLRNGC
jgi:hypothetical protein